MKQAFNKSVFFASSGRHKNAYMISITKTGDRMETSKKMSKTEWLIEMITWVSLGLIIVYA
jgi:hypothetical protein